jgi:hypothetical protein
MQRLSRRACHDGRGMIMGETRRIWVTEVHNVGGFFGGDTITLSATPWPDGEEDTLTIDEKALQNIRARHTIMPEMLLELEMTGDRVDRARLIGSRDRELMNDALRDVPSDSLPAPRIRAYHCERCNIWITGQPPERDDARVCAVCDQPLQR